jgi:colanic acid/amylovoran biosynthesis protein
MTDRRVTFAVLGGSLSGNKGAASMTLAVVDGVSERIPGLVPVVFSPYPAEDRRLAPDVEVVGFRPVDMLLKVLPAALLGLLTGRRWRPRRGVAGALGRARIAVDVSGVSFMDGRGGKILVYNCLLVLLPWALGVPLVKASQALGPFEERGNRTAAKLVLPRAAWIGTRGPRTTAFAEQLGLANAEPAADVAFLLHTDAASDSYAREVVPDTRTVLVLPSQVVADGCREHGVPYVDTLAELATGLQARGFRILVAAHSARAGAPAGRTNDLPLARSLAARIPGAALLDEEVDARALRSVIARTHLVITSRFHGMISGLATATPTFVVGWSHKYREVLADFGLERLAVDFRDLSAGVLLSTVLELEAARDEVIASIEAELPAVTRSAAVTIDRAVETLERSGGR